MSQQQALSKSTFFPRKRVRHLRTERYQNVEWPERLDRSCGARAMASTGLVEVGRPKQIGTLSDHPGGPIHGQRDERYHTKRSVSSLFFSAIEPTLNHTGIGGETVERTDRPVIWLIKRTVVCRLINQRHGWLVEIRRNGMLPSLDEQTASSRRQRSKPFVLTSLTRGGGSDGRVWLRSQAVQVQFPGHLLQ